MTLKKFDPKNLPPKTTPATNDEIIGLDAVTGELLRIPQKNVGESPFQKTDTTISPKVSGDKLNMEGGGVCDYKTDGEYLLGTGDVSLESNLRSNVPYLIQNPLAGNVRTITIPDAQMVVTGNVASFYLDGESANTGQVLIKTTNNQQINRDIIQVISSPGTGFTIQEFMGEWLIKQDNRPQPGAESIFLYPTLANVTNPSLDPTYLKLTNDTSDPDYPQTEQIATGPVVGPTVGVSVLQGVWTTDTSVIQTTFQGTEAKITTKLNITSGTGAELVSFAELYKRDALGVETLINTSLPTTVHVVDQVLYIFTIYIPPQTTIIDGEFLVWKFYAEKVGGQPSDTNQVQFAVGGFEDPARIGLPVPVGGFKVGINDVAGLSDELERLDNMPLILSQFDSNTIMSDPGAGKFRLNAGQIQLALNYQEPSGSNIKIHANKLSNGSTLKLQVKGDDSKYKNINVTGITDNTTWALIDITVDNEGNAFVLDDIVGLIIVGGSGSEPIVTNEQPISSIKFDKQYWPDETRQITMSGDLNLSLDTGVTNVVGNANFFDVVADGVGAINLVSGFKSNGVFPSDLNGKVLDAGTYLFCCIYSSNGIVVNVPALGGTAPTPGTPPYATNVYFTGQPVVGETMTGQYTYNDDEGNPESGTSYKWYRADNQSGLNRVEISGATFKNYVVQAIDENKYLQFEVTVSNATDGDGTPVQSAYSRQVSLTDTFPPEIQLAIVEDSNPNVVKLIFDEAVTATNVGYTVKYDTVTQTINSLSGSGTNELLLEINRYAQNGEIITVDYDSVTGDTIDGNTNELVSFIDKPVTNEVQSSPISAVPYNTDLTAMYAYNLRRVDDVSGNVTTLKNPISAALDLPCSVVDSRRPVVDDTNKRLLMYDKEILDGAYNFSADGTFTVVMRIEQRADDPNEQNRSLLYDGVSRTLNLRNFTQGYLINNLKTISKEFYDVHFGKHVITMVSDGANVDVYLDEKTNPIFTQAVALTDLDITSVLKNNTVLGKFEAVQEMLFYNRALTESERLIVARDYLGNKYGVDTGDRPVITSFGLTNVSNGGTVNNGDLGQFAFTTQDGRTIDRIILLQTSNAAFMADNNSYLILEDGAATSFNFDVPPFKAQGNNEMGIMVVDELGRVSDAFIDTTINFTITDL